MLHLKTVKILETTTDRRRLSRLVFCHKFTPVFNRQINTCRFGVAQAAMAVKQNISPTDFFYVLAFEAFVK